MKRKILTLFFLSVGVMSGYSQKDISGTYYTESGKKIEINENTLKLIVHETSPAMFYSEILAECEISRVNDDFIELNSRESPYMKALESVKITQKTDTISNDSITVIFFIPFQGKLKILVHTDIFKTFELDYTRNSKALTIPTNVKVISLYILPDYITPHTPEGLFYGVVGFDSMKEYPIEKGVNSVEIEIPAIDDSFFEKYYVKGDYARVSKDAIIWKGEVFKKRNN